MLLTIMTIKISKVRKMILCKLDFFVLLSLIFQSNGNSCTISGCQQIPSDILKENLTLTARLPSCTMARNYDGLSFSVVLENNNYQSCSWIFAKDYLDSNRNCVDYDRNTNRFSQENIFTSFVPCENRSLLRRELKEITCVMNGGKYYSSIVFRNISYNDWFVSLQCDGKYTKGFRIRVRECNATLDQPQNQVHVDSNSRDYNASGSFHCANNETLYYLNGTLLQNRSTSCLATAEWKGQKDLQCWKDPKVQLKGNYDWVNESKLLLQCKYDDSVPAGNKSIFYVNNKPIEILQKGEIFNLTVNKTFNKVPVSCQAQTPFTQINNATGWSEVHLLNVLFAPYPPEVECDGNPIADKICQIRFFSNPNATFISLFFEDRNITNSSDFSLTVAENHTHYFNLSINENIKNNSGTYNLTVYSMLQPYFHHIFFNITAESQLISTPAKETTVTTATTTVVIKTTVATAATAEATATPAPTATARALSKHTAAKETTAPIIDPFPIEIVVGSSVTLLSLIIILVFVFLKRKKKRENISFVYMTQSNEREMAVNAIYGSPDMLQDNESSEREEKMNELYGTTVLPDNRTSSQKEEKINELYGTRNMLGNKESSEGEEKINELYGSANMLDNEDEEKSYDSVGENTNDLYQTVDFSKKNKEKSTDRIGENTNDLYQTVDFTKKTKFM